MLFYNHIKFKRCNSGSEWKTRRLLKRSETLQRRGKSSIGIVCIIGVNLTRRRSRRPRSKQHRRGIRGCARKVRQIWAVRDRFGSRGAEQQAGAHPELWRTRGVRQREGPASCGDCTCHCVRSVCSRNRPRAIPRPGGCSWHRASLPPDASRRQSEASSRSTSRIPKPSCWTKSRECSLPGPTVSRRSSPASTHSPTRPSHLERRSIKSRQKRLVSSMTSARMPRPARTTRLPTSRSRVERPQI